MRQGSTGLREIASIFPFHSKELCLRFVNLTPKIENDSAFGGVTFSDCLICGSKCATRRVDAGLLAPHGFNLRVSEGVDGIRRGLEGLCTLLRILTCQIMLIGVEAHVAHENLQAKQAQARPADVNEMTFII